MDGLLSPWLPAPPRVETSPLGFGGTDFETSPAGHGRFARTERLAPPPETDRPSPPASLIQTAMVQNPSPSRDRTAPPQQINATASLPAATVRQQPPPAADDHRVPANSCRNYLLEISLCILTRHSRLMVIKLPMRFIIHRERPSTSFHLRYKTEKSLFVLQSTQFVRDPSAGTLPLLDIFWEKAILPPP
ncbi:UNVERIFIED_CONTAM: hypothetical protein Sradi_6848400 [Sesamum radiatum]|uniref:Uncharacterized protein n=1 Tax=Sesamum radiatum TaxID=300843 RepID=A0AAW2JL19_SESRA